MSVSTNTYANIEINAHNNGSTVYVIKQSALGRAIEETQERDLRAQGIKQIDGPKGLIVWPSIVKRPANTFLKRK